MNRNERTVLLLPSFAPFFLILKAWRKLANDTTTSKDFERGGAYTKIELCFQISQGVHNSFSSSLQRLEFWRQKWIFHLSFGEILDVGGFDWFLTNLLKYRIIFFTKSSEEYARFARNILAWLCPKHKLSKIIQDFMSWDFRILKVQLA